ncbi:MAG TPA: response regulator [Pseudolabrys sp.]|nr:response regulator [Pseudolabrys sp.]
MPSVLIIDDDKLVRETARILLSSKGYEVVLAENGKAGIEIARSRSFDAAIVDLFMPDMDGLQVIGAIHQSKPQLPMIAASGFMFGNGDAVPEMPDFNSMALEAGAISTLYKPFRPDALLNEVARAIGAAAA